MRPSVMNDPVLGELAYESDWRRSHEYRLFGRTFQITLVVPCDEGAEIEPAQIEAFLRFEAIRDQTPDLVVSAVLDYYLGIVDERREMAGAGLADKVAPLIATAEQLAPLIKPTELLIQQTLGSNKRVVGLLFDCCWDTSLGLAVKFVNESIEEVGPQDIVL
jgi:hypothetical protein